MEGIDQVTAQITQHEPTSHNWAGLIAAFVIFEKYGEGGFGTGAEHDVLYVYLNPETVSREDKALLKDLGWDPNGNDGFVKNV